MPKPPVKLLGLASAFGAAAATELTQPEEASALPAGVFKKASSKAAKGALSSASKVLQGRQIEGRTITAVRKGSGRWRAILFDDGTEMTVDKQYINDLCRAKGTKRKIEEFSEKTGEAKTLQALKSLRYHEARAEFTPRAYTRQMHQMYLKRAGELSKDLPPNTVFVQYNKRFFSMPQEYAEHLEDLGILKISRTKQDQKVLESTKRLERLKQLKQLKQVRRKNAK